MLLNKKIREKKRKAVNLNKNERRNHSRKGRERDRWERRKASWNVTRHVIGMPLMFAAYIQQQQCLDARNNKTKRARGVGCRPPSKHPKITRSIGVCLAFPPSTTTRVHSISFTLLPTRILVCLSLSLSQKLIKLRTCSWSRRRIKVLVTESIRRRNRFPPRNRTKEWKNSSSSYSSSFSCRETWKFTPPGNYYGVDLRIHVRLIW